MFRNSQMEKMRNDLTDPEEDVQFSGATLKISPDNDSDNSVRYRSNLNEADKSAILSGSDLSSLHEPVGNKQTSNAKCETALHNEDTQTIDEQFFSLRPGQFEKAVTDCVNSILKPTNDTNILGSWLLTEVSHWDHERERIFILTSKSLIIIKYDFIALKIVQNNKISLKDIDTVLQGKLTYPQSSLVPKFEGLTNGVTSIICGSFFCKTNQRNRNQQTLTRPIPRNNNLTVAKRFDFSCFRPIDRKDLGVRVMWNKGRPLSMLRSWNPFADDIPWKTIKDHPVYYAQEENMSQSLREEFEKNRHLYSIESFMNALMGVFSNANPDGVNFNCDFKDGPILMENYVGIGAVIHNKNNFGFFKVRGKFSF